MRPVSEIKGRRIKAPIPGLTIVDIGRKRHAIDYEPMPGDDSWEIARKLPSLVRKAIADDRAMRARMRVIHEQYRRRRA